MCKFIYIHLFEIFNFDPKPSDNISLILNFLKFPEVQTRCWACLVWFTDYRSTQYDFTLIKKSFNLHNKLKIFV